MKKKYVFLTLAFVFVCVLKMQAQNLETDIMKVLSQDETVLSFSKDESRNISGILASGDVKFTSTSWRRFRSLEIRSSVKRCSNSSMV